MPGAAPTIADAVASAAPGDVVTLAPGVYTEHVTVAIDLEIHGGPGVSWVAVGEDPLLTVSGATVVVRDVVFEGGGGLEVMGGALEVVRCTVRNAEGADGGGVRAEDAELVLRDARFEDNAAGRGAHVYVEGGSLTIERGSY
ncbi:MAG: hypothetical protein ABMA64_28210, partial [Myxococcota bacterium]